MVPPKRPLRETMKKFSRTANKNEQIFYSNVYINSFDYFFLFNKKIYWGHAWGLGVGVITPIHKKIPRDCLEN